ncbi:hypothetical protein LIER_12973 [Lithospermum erythrorhizon]|uniref:Gag-pol polyprotein n=1 Tax=Lithospermum erythrorhizon TaxID=34254 RepID=A0AAV3PVT1_LITER
MEAEFEINMVGELKYFLGFQINQMEDIIFISQSKYTKNIVKKFGLEMAKPKRNPFPTYVKVTKDEAGKSVDDQVVNLEHVSTDKQVADILTKGLDVNQFEYLRTALGLCVLDN